jgi:MSHA biogenesis protein MshO
MMSSGIRDTRFEVKGSRYTSPLSFLLCKPKENGFTLVEMIMVIVITGIIGGMVAVFLRAPIQQYMDVSRRADMTDIADTAIRRIGRDLRLALPNSVRVTTVGGSTYLEFLPTTGGGRYRTAVDAGGAGNILDFSNAADTSFDVLGQPVAANAGDTLVIYNLGIPSSGGCASLGADAYEGCNRRAIVSGGATITFTASTPPLPFPFDSPSHRFQVITTPVTYVCNAPATNAAGNGTGQLIRWQGYTIQAAQPTALPATGTLAVLANNVSACNFSYNAFVVAQRSGLVTMNLGITESNETVTLYSAVHVSNMP